MKPSLVVRRLIAVPVLALLLAGCFGGDGPPPPPRTAATEPPPPAVTSLGVLKTYRYAIALRVASDALGAQGAAPAAPSANSSFRIAIDGEVVNPDRERSETRASLGFIELTLERVQVGGRAWTREPGGEWKRATPGSSSALPGGEFDISPARLFAPDGTTFAALNRELGRLESYDEPVNGIAARRYDFNPEQFKRIFTSGEGVLPGSSRPVETWGSLWIAEGSRLPVRIRFTSSTPDGQPAFEMDLSLSDLNADIAIQPPI